MFKQSEVPKVRCVPLVELCAKRKQHALKRNSIEKALQRQRILT